MVAEFIMKILVVLILQVQIYINNIAIMETGSAVYNMDDSIINFNRITGTGNINCNCKAEQ